MKLTFVIPTRKRHRELAACLRSIADQVQEGQDVNIVVLFNHEEIDTVRVIERCAAKWPFISSVGFDGEPDYATKFKEMFLAAPESDWVWTFGDDESLEPNALKFMLPRLEKAEPELAFIHISEKVRSTGSGHTYTGRMIDLCCELGWVEFTGFISGNITRGNLLAECGRTPNWGEYAKTAFVQSCALLEVLRKEQAQFIDLPLFKSQDDLDEHVAEVRNANWAAANTEVRYMKLADALQLMYDQGFLKSKLPVKFFRYHNYHLWDRHLIAYVLMWLQENKIWFDDWVFYVKRLASFVADKDAAAKICEEAAGAQRWVLMHAALSENCKILKADLMGILEKRTIETYPLTFVPKTEERKAA